MINKTMKPMTAARLIKELLEITERDKSAKEWSDFYREHRSDPDTVITNMEPSGIRMAEYQKEADGSWEGWIVYPDTDWSHSPNQEDCFKVAASEENRISKLANVLDKMIFMNPYAIHIRDTEVTVADIRAALTEISRTDVARAVQMVKFLDKGRSVVLDKYVISSELKK